MLLRTGESGRRAALSSRRCGGARGSKDPLGTQDFAVEGAALMLRFGFKRQTVEIGGVASPNQSIGQRLTGAMAGGRSTRTPQGDGLERQSIVVEQALIDQRDIPDGPVAKMHAGRLFGSA